MRLRKRWTGKVQCWDCLCLDGKADGQCRNNRCACHEPGAVAKVAPTLPCYDCGCPAGVLLETCPIKPLEKPDFPTPKRVCCHGLVPPAAA